MSEDMVKDGFEDIVNVDISSVAIEMMRKKYADIPQLNCILTISVHLLCSYVIPQSENTYVGVVSSNELV